MACLTGEQLVRLALGLAEEEHLAAHVDRCEACQAKLVEVRRLADQLALAHAELDSAHAASRSRLLASLSSVEIPALPSGVWNRLAFRIGGLTMRERVAAVGVGVAAVVGFVLVFLASNSSGQLSAMDRMTKAVREVKSYSYTESEDVTVLQKGKQPGTVKLRGANYWHAPGSFREESRIEIGGDVPRGYRQGQAVADFVTINPAGKPGIMIFNNTKGYIRTPELDAMGTGSGSLTYPLSTLRLIQEGESEIVRDLGTKNIQGKQAHGYIMVYHTSDNTDTKTGETEIWLDPDTDLPLEYSFVAKDETTTEKVRVADFQWNVDLDPKLFDTTPPEGYTDATPPTDPRAVDQIRDALALYAALSGGRYPQIDPELERFDAAAIHHEMLKMAGFSGPPQAAWEHDEKFQRIQRAIPGLDWISRIVLDTGNAGYRGSKVTPEDKDKALLWWKTFAPTRYHVFYGDRRTEVLNETDGERLTHTPKLFEEQE